MYREFGMKFLMFAFLVIGILHAEVMSINTPLRGEVYEQTKLLMEELFKRHSYELEFQKLPLKRALINANRGLDDGDGPRVREIGNKYTNLVRIEVPILKISIHAHYKDKAIKINNWNDIKPYHVAVRTGTLIQVNNVKKIGPKEITYVATNEKLFELLEEKKVDIVIAGRTQSRGVQRKIGYKNIIESPPLLQKDMYLYLNKKHKDRVESFERTLLKMKDEGYQERLKVFYETGKVEK